jgi:multiple sugar transport system substrate-binding protein
MTIRHMPWEAPKDIQAAEDVAKAFNQKNGRVTVKVEPAGGLIYDKLTALFAANQAPETFYLQGWLWQQYAVRGMLVDLAPVMRKDRAFNVSEVFPPAHADQTRWKDGTFMVPNDTGGFVLYYNRDLFDRAGVPYPTDRWTWDDWQKAARELTKGEGSEKVFGYEAQENWRRNSWWIKQAGKEAWDRIAGPSKSLLDDPVVLDAVQRQVDTRLKHRVAPMPEDGATFANGRAAMKIEGDWIMFDLKQAGRVRWDVAPLPRDKKQATVLLVHGSSAAVSGTDHDAAWEWLKYYTTEEAQRIHVTASGRVAITPELAKRIFLPIAKDSYGAARPEVFLTRWEHGSHFGITDVLDSVERDAINPAFTAVFRGQQAVSTALPEAARLATQILKGSRMVTGQ